MKISYNWLKEHIQLTESPEEIAALLTRSGLEVESVEVAEKVKGGLKGLMIGKVLSCEKHPNADKLKKTQVDVGQGIILPIVCGAPNVAAGQTVVVATVGTVLYSAKGESFKISKAKIRGEISEGMICAEDEVGLGENHEGIMVIQESVNPGTPLSKFLGLKPDFIFEIGLTPNRGDAASHLGVARDLRALLHRDLIKQKFSIRTTSEIKVNVEVKDPDACIRYTGLTIENVRVKESPEWLKDKLKSIGLSPINNIVDITNFILHDLGQPLHAFDLKKIKGSKIVVQTLPEGTTFVTLDGEKRTLKNSDLMICNESEPMCIAGVFGGLESGVTQSTEGVFLESACFSSDAIRRTAMGHGLKTDSSFRFERGTDPELPPDALLKAAKLITEVSGGEITSALIDIYPEPVKPLEVVTSFFRMNKLVGKVIEKESIREILADLDFKLKEETEKLLVQVPTYRTEVTREADVIEEIIRIYGYDNIEIPDKIQTNFLATFPAKDEEKLQQILGTTLIGKGFNEIITNSLTSYRFQVLCEEKQHAIPILNRLSEDLGVLRQTLLFNGLEVLNYNISRKQKDLKLFEFGKTYFKEGKAYKEKKRLAIFLTGTAESENWFEKSDEVDFFHLKQIVENILVKMNAPRGGDSSSCEDPLLEFGLTYCMNQQPVVNFGLVSSKVLKIADMKQKVFYADFDWDLLFANYSAGVKYIEVPKFPEVRRDLSLVLDRSVTFANIEKTAKEKEKRLLKSLNVFDVYEGKNIGEGKKSYSVSFILQDSEKTLTDKIIDSVMQKLIKGFEHELGAVIRK